MNSKKKKILVDNKKRIIKTLQKSKKGKILDKL